MYTCIVWKFSRTYPASRTTTAVLLCVVSVVRLTCGRSRVLSVRVSRRVVCTLPCRVRDDREKMDERFSGQGSTPPHHTTRTLSGTCILRAHRAHRPIRVQTHRSAQYRIDIVCTRHGSSGHTRTHLQLPAPDSRVAATRGRAKRRAARTADWPSPGVTTEQRKTHPKYQSNAPPKRPACNAHSRSVQRMWYRHRHAERTGE